MSEAPVMGLVTFEVEACRVLRRTDAGTTEERR